MQTQTHFPQIGRSRTVAAEISVFRPVLWRKYFFGPFRPNEHPQVLYMVGKLRISSFLIKKIDYFFYPVKHQIFFCEGSSEKCS